MSADEEKDPPVPADVAGKVPRKVHDGKGAPTHEPDDDETPVND
jgi:hypothetical protein